MSRALATCLIAFTACTTTSMPGGGSGSGSGSGDPGGTECGDRVVAAGYPKVGAGCKTHAILQEDANKYDFVAERGIGPIGSTLTGFGVHDIANEENTVTVTLPALATGTYNECVSLELDHGLSSDIHGRVTTTIDGTSADAVWGQVDGKACKVSGYVVIDGMVYTSYACVEVSGKFAGLREPAAIDCPDCGPPTFFPSGCDLPYCTDNGCSSAVCGLGTQTCGTLAPDLVGTYTGDTGYIDVTMSATFANDGKLLAIELAGLFVDVPGGFEKVTYRATSFPPGSLAQQGAFFQAEVDATSMPDVGTAHLYLSFANIGGLDYTGQIMYPQGVLDLHGTLRQ